MLPLRSVPPSGDPPETEMVNVSLVPGSPLSVTLTVKVQGDPLLVHVPPNVAVLPAITSEVNVTLCTFAPLAWLMYCKSPLTGPLVDFRSRLPRCAAFAVLSLTAAALWPRFVFPLAARPAANPDRPRATRSHSAD